MMWIVVSLLVAGVGSSTLEPTRLYDKSLRLETLDYELWWTVDAVDVHVAMLAKTTGWIGLGFADPAGGGMPGADMVIATTTTLEDTWAKAYAAPEPDSCQDWDLVSRAENGTFMLIEASRPKDTGDLQDRVVGDDLPRRLVAAFGDTTQMSYHGPRNRAAFRLDDVFEQDQTPLEKLLAEDPTIEAIELLNSAFVIPQDETTYAYKTFDLDDATLGGAEGHIVAIAPKVSESTAQYVHHFIAAGTNDHLRTNSPTANNETNDDDDCNLRDLVTCDGGVLFFLTGCSSCDPAFCGVKTAIDPLTCDDPSRRFGLSCNGDSLDATLCTQKLVFRNVSQDATCGCDFLNRNVGSPALPPNRNLYFWNPGDQPMILPLDAGLPLRGDRGYDGFILSIHYNNPYADAGMVDNSGIILYVTRNKRPHDVAALEVGDPQVLLTGTEIAGTSGLAKHSFVCPSSCLTNFFGDTQVTVFGLIHHQHGAGARFVTRKYSAGDLAATIVTEFFDYHFQDHVDLDALIGAPTFSLTGTDVRFAVSALFFLL